MTCERTNQQLTPFQGRAKVRSFNKVAKRHVIHPKTEAERAKVSRNQARQPMK
jgi:hypothetical protein